MNTINIGDRGNLTSYFQDIPPSPQPSVQSFKPFNFVNLPKDLQRLVLSFCDAETKCELIAVSHFTSNYIARDKVERALDWIFKSPRMKQHLAKKQIGVQQLVYHVFERFRQGGSFFGHRLAFAISVLDHFSDYFNNFEEEREELDLFTKTLLKIAGQNDYKLDEEELYVFTKTLWNTAGKFKTSN